MIPAEWVEHCSPYSLTEEDYFAAVSSPQEHQRNPQVEEAKVPALSATQLPLAAGEQPELGSRAFHSPSSAKAGPWASQCRDPALPIPEFFPNASRTYLLSTPRGQTITPTLIFKECVGGADSDDPPGSSDDTVLATPRQCKTVLSRQPKTLEATRVRKTATSRRSVEEHELAVSVTQNEQILYDRHQGGEMDTKIWGMDLETYKALSAKERKKVRNRISARAFRAKRKQHVVSLHNEVAAKDVKIKLAQDEAGGLRRQVDSLKNRLAKYEVV